MKRDWDLIREILLKLEQQAEARGLLKDSGFIGYQPETVSYHFKLLHSAGLIEAVDYSSMNELCYVARSLTWDGHEFLDRIRSETVWNNLKTVIRSKSLELSFESIKQVANQLIGSMLTI